MQLSILNSVIDKLKPASEVLAGLIGKIPETAVIAGSGISTSLDQNKILQSISYSDLKILPKLSVEGHNEKILLYEIHGKRSLIFAGRFHFYENLTYEEICSLVILCYLIGIKKIVLSNAAGGLNPDYNPGDIMLIDDFIDFTFLFPPFFNNHSFLDRNHTLIHLNDSNFNQKIKEKLNSRNIKYQSGVYVSVTGPSYETRSEIKMLRKIGGDAVGMSTVPEIITAGLLGTEIFAFSVITNILSENVQYLTHNDVIKTANEAADIIKNIIEIAITV